MSTHVYQPLEGPAHIRLIALHPASSKDAPLEITFLASALDDLEGSYEAISYTWGESVLVFPLHVHDGTQVCVTRNLDRALRYLRRSDRDRLLWADAACINQDDKAEKAIQIPLMVKIFRGATRVMAWLDPGGDTTAEQRGMWKLDRFSRMSGVPRWDSFNNLSEVLSFFNLPWFNRLWIVQEIVFSLDICLICGDTELSFSRLIVALSVLETDITTYDAADQARMRAILNITKLWNRHSFLGQGSEEADIEDTTQILSLVENFRSYGCTDDRDRIFALYSMATDIRSRGGPHRIGRDISFSIDYSLDVCQTYHSFAWSCWEQFDRHQEMWEALLSRQHSSPKANWFSWAPDWRVLPRQTWSRISDAHDYQLIGLQRSERGILRMGFAYRGPRQDDGPGNLYTIHLKTSRTAEEDQTHLLSHLARFYTSLQNRRRFLVKSSLLPERLKTNLHNDILLDIIKALLPQHSRTKSMVDVGQYLGAIATGTIEPGSGLNALLSCVHTQYMIRDLNRNLEGNELFYCQDPMKQTDSIGFGNKRLDIGDKIIALDERTGYPSEDIFIRVLIVREAGYLENAQEPAFRLVGSGYLLDYTWFYLDQDLLRYQGRNAGTYAENAAWDEFNRIFKQTGGRGFLNLV